MKKQIYIIVKYLFFTFTIMFVVWLTSYLLKIVGFSIIDDFIKSNLQHIYVAMSCFTTISILLESKSSGLL